MSEQLRQRLLDEMDSRQRPPVDGLVSGAVERGRRRRRTRRVVAGAGTTAVVGVTVLAVGIGASIAPKQAPRTAGIDAGAATTTSAPKPVVTTATAAATTAASAASTRPAVTAKASPAATGGFAAGGKLAAAQAWHTLQAARSAAEPPHWTAAPAGVKATPQGELALFTELAKPYGTISALGVSGDASEADGTHVRANLTTPDGKVGEVQFFFEHDTLGQAADCMSAPASFVAQFGDGAAPDVACRPTPDGGYVIVTQHSADNGCLNAAELTVVHPDGTAVDVSVASCWTDFANGMHDGAQPLTEAQAEQIFTDARFDFTMPQDVVTAGEALGTLRTFW